MDELHALRASHEARAAIVSVDASAATESKVTNVLVLEDPDQHEQDLMELQQLRQWHHDVQQKVHVDASTGTTHDEHGQCELGLVWLDRAVHDQQTQEFGNLKHVHDQKLQALDDLQQTHDRQIQAFGDLQQTHDQHVQAFEDLQQAHDQHVQEMDNLKQVHDEQTRELGELKQVHDQQTLQLGELQVARDTLHAARDAAMDAVIMTDDATMEIVDSEEHAQTLARLADLEAWHAARKATQDAAVHAAMDTDAVLIIDDAEKHHADMSHYATLQNWHAENQAKQENGVHASVDTEAVLIIDDAAQHAQDQQQLADLKAWKHEVDSKQLCDAEIMTDADVLIVDDAAKHHADMHHFANLQTWHAEHQSKQENAVHASMDTDAVLIVDDEAQHAQDQQQLADLKAWKQVADSKQLCDAQAMTDAVLIVNDETQHSQDQQQLADLKAWKQVADSKVVCHTDAMTEPILIVDDVAGHEQNLQQLSKLKTWHDDAQKRAFEQIALSGHTIDQPPVVVADNDCQTDRAVTKEQALQTSSVAMDQGTQSFSSKMDQGTQIATESAIGMHQGTQSALPAMDDRGVQASVAPVLQQAQVKSEWAQPAIPPHLLQEQHHPQHHDSSAFTTTSYSSTSASTASASPRAIVATEHATVKLNGNDNASTPSVHVTTPPLDATNNATTTGSITSSLHDEQATTYTATTLDPAITSITQTMIGEWLFKYTRKPMGQTGFSDRCHQRYFWIHPYTRTLYWCHRAPGADGGEIKAKSAFVENVTVLPPAMDAPANDTPCILIQTATRQIKVKAISKDRHDLWLESLTYLMTRQNPTPSPTPRQIDMSPSLRPQRSFSASLLGKKPSFQRLDQLFRASTSSSQDHTAVTTPNHHHHLLDDEDDDDDALENVRLCCNGKHDVGRLEKPHAHRPAYHHHHHHRLNKKTSLTSH
ncbi:meiotic cell cortex C-terminal pleckstrin homology-domain-containing protein [Gongronella butleri]|nr:meiotic cell cortex C-terminal pleckstrin homology-domain-containing protein [Gongronella butleri]